MKSDAEVDEEFVRLTVRRHLLFKLNHFDPCPGHAWSIQVSDVAAYLFELQQVEREQFGSVEMLQWWSYAHVGGKQ